MDRASFSEICVEAGKRTVKGPGRISNLKLSIINAGESLIRGPEMIHAFVGALNDRDLCYEIEGPTDGRYRFIDQAGDRTMRARHDLVIFGERRPEVLVEL